MSSPFLAADAVRTRENMESSVPSITFSGLCDEPLEPVNMLYNEVVSMQQFTSRIAAGEGVQQFELLQTGGLSTATEDMLKSVIGMNGLVGAVIKAYSYHHALVLRPEDFWMAILAQLSFYVNANAEELRSKFVAHEGKKELEIVDDGALRSWNYEKLMTQMVPLM